MSNAPIRSLIPKATWLWVVACAAIIPLQAQSHLTLDEALQQARKSPLYHARLQRIEALKGRLEQAGKRPNPTLSSDLLNGAVFGEPGDNEVSLEFSQPWERGGKRRLREQMADVRVRLAELEIQDFLRIQSADIRGDYLRLLRGQNEKTLLTAHKARLDALMQFDQVRVEQGEIPSINLEFLGGELAAMTTRLNHLDMEQNRVHHHLKTVMGLEATPEPQTDYSQPELPPLEELTRMALENRPDLEKMKTTLALADHEIESEKIKNTSDWEWGLGYAFTRDTHGANDIRPAGVIDDITSRSHLLAFKLTIPLKLWDDNSGNVTAALATKKGLESELAYFESFIRNEVASAYFAFEHSELEKARYRQEVIPKLQAGFERIEAAYQLTGEDLLGWIGIQRDFWNAVVDGINADYTLQKSVIELEKVVGVQLEQAGQNPPSTRAVGTPR